MLGVVAHTKRPHPALPGAGTSGPFSGQDPAVLNLEELLGLSCVWQRDWRELTRKSFQALWQSRRKTKVLEALSAAAVIFIIT